MELPGASLDTIPNLSGSRWRALSSNKVINPRLELCERALDVSALAEASAEERGVDDQQDPAPTLEEDGREEETRPQRNLEAGDDGHGGIIVLLDKGANGIGERVRVGLRLRTGSSSGGGSGGGDGRDDGGAGVGRKVEDGVDAVRQQCDGVLGREEPDKGHDYNKEHTQVSRVQHRFGKLEPYRAMPNS